MNSSNLNRLLGSAILAGVIATAFNAQEANAIWPFNKKDKQAQEQEDLEQPSLSSEEQANTEESPTSSENSLNSSTTDATLSAPSGMSITEQQVQSGAPSLAMPSTPYGEPETKVQVVSPLTKDDSYGLTVADPSISPDAPPTKVLVTVDDPKNPLGITQSADKLNKISSLIEAKKYAEAKAQLEPLMQWLIDSTEAHINLNKTLSKIPSARVQSELEKQLALQFAMLRDKAFFNRALIAIGENKPSESVKHLSRVVQSQPRSPIGLKSYEMLQSIGFTEKIQLQEAASAP